MKLRYSRRALSQLASLYEYLQERGPAAAGRVTASIRSTIERLREMPLLGKVTDEPGVHVIIDPQYGYRVFYKLESRIVFVVAVLHGRQSAK